MYPAATFRQPKQQLIPAGGLLLGLELPLRTWTVRYTVDLYLKSIRAAHMRELGGDRFAGRVLALESALEHLFHNRNKKQTSV